MGKLTLDYLAANPSFAKGAAEKLADIRDIMEPSDMTAALRDQFLTLCAAAYSNGLRAEDTTALLESGISQEDGMLLTALVASGRLSPSALRLAIGDSELMEPLIADARRLSLAAFAPPEPVDAIKPPALRDFGSSLKVKLGELRDIYLGLPMEWRSELEPSIESATATARAYLDAIRSAVLTWRTAKREAEVLVSRVANRGTGEKARALEILREAMANLREAEALESGADDMLSAMLALRVK